MGKEEEASRGSRRLLVCRAAVTALIALLLLLALEGTAAASGTSYVSLFSDQARPPGGDAQLFHSGNSQISLSGSAADLTVNVKGALGDDTFEFAAPPGRSLATGFYENAQRVASRAEGHPGIDINGKYRDCNTTDGRFEVRDIATGADGTPSRLWIIFEQHCAGGAPSLFGEVTINEPTPVAPALFAPSIIRWPPLDLGRSGAFVPATVLIGSQLRFNSLSVVGQDQGDFPIRVDGCRDLRIETWRPGQEGVLHRGCPHRRGQDHAPKESAQNPARAWEKARAVACHGSAQSWHSRGGRQPEAKTQPLTRGRCSTYA